MKGGKTAHVQWSPPVLGNYNGFKLKVIFFINSLSGINNLHELKLFVFWLILLK